MYDKFLSASIDLRFDQKNDYTSDGLVVNSFENVKRTIDSAKAAGFKSIDICTNVPINALTGELQLNVDSGPNGDKRLPKDIWKIIDYAKSLGLGASIELNIVDAINDNAITTSYVGKNFSTETFFTTVKNYETAVAELAEFHKVDAISIGVYNFGFDQKPFESNWIEVINSIRKVYSGELAYGSDFRSDNIVWNHVDALCMGFNVTLSQSPQYDPTYLISKYFNTEDISAQGGPQNAYQLMLNQISAHPNKKYYIWNERISPAMEAVGNTKDLWSILMDAQAQGIDPSLSTVKFDDPLMLAWYQTFFQRLQVAH